jgi:hypothetical protein
MVKSNPDERYTRLVKVLSSKLFGWKFAGTLPNGKVVLEN